MAIDYQLTFAGVPFVADVARTVGVRQPNSTIQGASNVTAKHQPLVDLIAELDRLIPWRHLHEFKFPTQSSRNTSTLGQSTGVLPEDIRIGDFYYPPTASRWSVFRGLATSRQTQAMLAATEGYLPASFVMKALPERPGTVGDVYTVSTSMYLLPPRPLAEHGGTFDGLFLITLVDERYFWQHSPVSLRVRQETTWLSLLTSIANTLSISLSVGSIAEAYGQPEIDSQLWSNLENAPVLLDAIAANIGCTFVRKLTGAYHLESTAISIAVAESNRTASSNVRTAGGELFGSGINLPSGNRTAARNTVVPAVVHVGFPKYVTGNDPVPHFVNSRFSSQRSSTWHESSDLYTISVPIASGGTSVAGLTGVGNVSLRDTAKALLVSEASTTPSNIAGLTALALEIASNHYQRQVGSALDEVYPGTLAWVPEGFHDIIWRYSERARGATTRVCRAEWNHIDQEYQHATPAITGLSNTPAGVGGPSVALTIRDSTAATPTTTLTSALLVADLTAQLASVDYLPTQNRWRAQIDDEIVLFEGTSGSTTVSIVYRGIDGTLIANHANGATVTPLAPNITYGVNLITYEKGQFVYPSQWTSGGIQGVNVVPQLQTVRVLSSFGDVIDGRILYSGQLGLYAEGNFTAQESIWVTERNNGFVKSGFYYAGQFVGYNGGNVTVAPVYGINAGSEATLSSGSVTSGMIASGAITSGMITSGMIASGAISPHVCTERTWTEYQVRCEENELRQYERTMTVNIVDGCINLEEGDWEEGDCLAKDVTCCGRCCPEDEELPSVLVLTLENGTEGCDFLNGSEVDLIYNPETEAWEGELSGPTPVTVICEDNAFQLELTGDYCVTTGPIAADPDPTCDPPCIRWTAVPISSCCEGTVDFVIGCEDPEVINCCPDGEVLPASVTLNFLEQTGSCGCLTAVVLNYDEELGYHTGTSTFCSGVTVITLRCAEGDSGYSIEMTGSVATSGPILESPDNAERDCNPPCLRWDEAFSVTGACTGTTKARIGTCPLPIPDTTVTCCGEDMPETLAVTVSGSGPCSGSGTLTYGPTLNWPVFFGNEPENAWQGSVALGESTMDFWLYCNPDTPGELKLGIGGCYVSNSAPGGTCTGPLNLTQTFSNGSCCGADVNNYEYTVTITSVP